eukprot:3935689-Pleurochrysis_carterae.AAC.1
MSNAPSTPRHARTNNRARHRCSREHHISSCPTSPRVCFVAVFARVFAPFTRVPRACFASVLDMQRLSKRILLE